MKKTFCLLITVALLLSFAVYAAKDSKSTKSPKTQTNPVIKAILDSGSTRAFKNQDINDQTIDLIIQCGIKAPSAMNQQPWHFSVVKDRRLLDKINGEAPSGPPKGADPKKPGNPKQPHQSAPGKMPKRHMFSMRRWLL